MAFSMACRERVKARASVEAGASIWFFWPVGKLAWAAAAVFPSPLVVVTCQGERKPVVTLRGRVSTGSSLKFD